ncbi:MAG: energy-coupling factor transporter transmembrane component T family protein [Culicoidibacterales bacterium]
MKMLKLEQYIPTGSRIHQLEPHVKILLFGIYITMMLMVQSVLALCVAMFGLGLLIIQTKIPWQNYWKVIKRIKWLVAFLFGLNILFLQQGIVLIELGSFQVYSGAIQQSIQISFQLVYMMVISAILLYTTTPLQLMSGIEWFLTPLKKMGIQTEQFLLILFIIFRFIPILLTDFEQLQFAQASRGAYIYEGNLAQRLKAFPSLLVPLFETSLFHAQQTAKMLIARKYDQFSNFKALNISKNKLNKNYLFLQAISIYLVFIWSNYQGISL